MPKKGGKKTVYWKLLNFIKLYVKLNGLTLIDLLDYQDLNIKNLEGEYIIWNITDWLKV